MTDILCFDPGETTGWALFTNGVLAIAQYEKFADVIVDPPCLERFALVIIEKPQWRPHERKIDINDLIELAVMVGELKRVYRSFGSDVNLVVPTTWKGSVPKEIHNRRVLSHLSPEELARVPLRPRSKKPDHNAVDAIGLGLWKLRRMR